MSNYGIVVNNENKIREWINSGLSAYRIAKELKCSKSSVLVFMKKNNIISLHKSKCNSNNLLKDKKDEVIQLYLAGKSQHEIARILGFSQPNIGNLLKKENIKLHEWKYFVDESFFNNIDSEEKAYILGWLYSDCSVDNSGKFRIQILATDGYILEWIKKQLLYDGPIFDIPARNNSRPQKALIINRKSITDKLINYGCNTNKSNILQFPTFDKIPQELFHHFLRGHFDKKFNVNITSSVPFCKGLQKYCNDLNIQSSLYFHKNVGKLFFNKSAKIDFLNHIYKDSSICLERKRAKYIQFLEKVYPNTEVS